MTPYYDDGQIVIYHADCRDVLPQIEAGSVDRVITDPPYGVEFSGKQYKKRGGGHVTAHGGYGFDDSPEYIFSVVVPVIEQCRRIARSVVVTPGVRNLWRYPEPKDLGCWYTPSGNGMSSWGFCCAHPILYYGADPYLETRRGSRPNSTGYAFPNDANGTGHPCAKPIRFVTWLVNRASLPGDTILDPFAGSGTTLRAAKDLGRKAIGIEIDERYVEIAVKRLQQAVLPLEVPA